MRKMASIQRIVDVQPLENADRLEVATVLGYHAVIGKGQFQPGDLCVYIECDAICLRITLHSHSSRSTIIG